MFSFRNLIKANKMKKAILSLLTWSLPFLLMAQNETSHGIKWTDGLTWEQVKQKAKQENKYIFVDAYATWCGPCKAMDKDVYTADTVGDIINEKFVAVKVQMDKTPKDNEQVKLWYSDADSIKNRFHIDAYPTLLFLNPEGQVTDKQLGFKPLGEFITLLKMATSPGKIYDDPYVDYSLRLSNYRHGMKEFDKYPSMIKMADKLHDTALSKQLRKELTDYLASLPIKERYTKERIEFCNNYTWLSNTKVFSYFYKDASLINKVMRKKSYAENLVDRTIQYEIVMPFLKEQAKGTKFSMEGGGYLTYGGKGIAPNADYREADWECLEKLIRSKYSKNYAKRNVLLARVEWYKRHLNKNSEIEYSLKLYNSFPPDVNDKAIAYKINEPAWDAFLNSTNKKLLKGYAKWMRKVVQNYSMDDAAIDTYANLLYKLGHKRKALELEKKALKLSPENGTYSKVVEQMKNSTPTYIDQGALWPKTANN
jgi:thioredoxin-related protein